MQEKLFAGCDVGSTTGKAVLIRDGSIVGSVVVPCLPRPEKTAELVMNEVVKQAGLSSITDLAYLVGTGYGRMRIPFANENISEITCHARGASWLCQSVKTAIDIGGQDCKVIGISNNGRVREFLMNDKCAAGTGRFFEAMGRVLHLTLEEISALSLKSASPANITSQCSVFAESEVVSLLNDGVDVVDIAAGINLAIASRLTSLVRKVGIVEDVTVTGGCAKNAGLIKCLEDRLKSTVKLLPEDPQIVGAIGAAVLAREQHQKLPRS
ncbi:CoA activase [Candidatus Poribacteria bacterium]|nr:CoA activase [Candidatus Poribacteria bacterium]